MLGNIPFSYDMLRKYTVAFGNLFSNIQIVRQGATKSGHHFAQSVDDEGVNLQLIKIPLTYSPKDKLLARVLSEPTGDRKDALTLPRIGFYMPSMDYDPSRKIGSVRNFSVQANTATGIIKNQLSPVPYILHFTVMVATKYQEEGNQIIEQIIPFFTPDFPMRLNLIPEMGVSLDSPVFLRSVRKEDSFEGRYEDRRLILWTLEFDMVAEFFGPIRRHPVIKFVEIDMIDATLAPDITKAWNTLQPVDRVTLQPGLTANGQPTTDPKKSVDYHTINLNDDWGYAFEVAGNLTATEGTGGTPDDNI